MRIENCGECSAYAGLPARDGSTFGTLNRQGAWDRELDSAIAVGRFVVFRILSVSP
jgi:hypothetical protein